MKIVILTGDQQRHLALVSYLASEDHDICAVYIEHGYTPPSQKNALSQRSTVGRHFMMRGLSEGRIFASLVSQMEARLQSSTQIKHVPYLSLRGDDFCDHISLLSPDLIVVYGTSIIKGKLVSTFSGRILNLHLGLSPYYRGSGTLLFPFVNNENQYAGSTFMLLDNGIDTGPILHQEVMFPDLDATFYDNCNLFIYQSFLKYSKLVKKICLVIEEAKEARKEFTWSRRPRRYYKDSDFDDKALLRLYENYSLLQLKRESMVLGINPVILKSSYL